MASLVLRANRLLRGEPFEASLGKELRALVLIVLLCGVGYGTVMGTFGGVSGARIWQVFYSGAKVPLLLLATFLLSLPSFFVLNTLLGVREDFPQALTALAATQAGLTVILLSLAPYTAFWYASSSHYRAAILFNGAMFAAASFAAQGLLRHHYRRLIAKNPRHRLLLRVWLLLYVFVGVQMGWVLRPFVGQPDMPVQFFRPGAWGNAYVEVLKMIAEILGR